MKRFVNEDTVLGGILNGQSLNRFAYVNGNPISLIDPLGMCGENAGGSNSDSRGFNLKQYLLDAYSGFYTLFDEDENKKAVATIIQNGSNGDVALTAGLDFLVNVAPNLIPAKAEGKIATNSLSSGLKLINIDLQLFAKKGDIKQIEAAAKRLKMTPEQRREFGDFVESLKGDVGKPGNKNFTFNELLEIGKEYLGID